MSNRFLTLFALLSLLLVAACGEKEASVEESLKKASDSVGELKSAVADFSPEKLELLASISAKLESAPAEAKKMLEEHDWSTEEFQKMVDQVQNNEAAKKIFDAAKKMSSEH